MITTDTFTNFARRLAATQGFPYVIIAETPNPIRQLADDVLRRRAEGMIETIIEGLTLPADDGLIDAMSGKLDDLARRVDVVVTATGD